MNQQGKTGLLDCHKALSLRRPKDKKLVRMASFNKTNLSIFQKELQELYEMYQFTNNDVFNLDETGCSTVHKNVKSY